MKVGCRGLNSPLLPDLPLQDVQTPYAPRPSHPCSCSQDRISPPAFRGDGDAGTRGRAGARGSSDALVSSAAPGGKHRGDALAEGTVDASGAAWDNQPRLKFSL